MQPPEVKQEVFELGSLSLEKVIDYNDTLIQAGIEKPQNSFEQLGIKEWEVTEISGKQLEDLQYFVETTGEGVQAYHLWKFFGHNIRIIDLIKRINIEGIPEYAKDFLKNLTPEEFNPDEIEKKIEKGDIYPPILIDIPGLKVGDIIDGNHRLLEIAKWLSTKDEAFIDSFKLKVIVGHIPMHRYIPFVLFQLGKANFITAKIRIQKLLGQELKGTKEEDFMNFFEPYYLLLQRIGFYDKPNGKENTQNQK